MLKTHLQFASSQFPIIPGEVEETNPGIYGRALAQFLEDQLNEEGYRAGAIAEDWGYCVTLGDAPFLSFVGCSSYGDEGEWLVFIEPSKPVVRKLFKKIDATPWIGKLAETLERVLRDQGGAQNIRWWDDRESGRN